MSVVVVSSWFSILDCVARPQIPVGGRREVCTDVPGRGSAAVQHPGTQTEDSGGQPLLRQLLQAAGRRAVRPGPGLLCHPGQSRPSQCSSLPG